jgi:hypothetical protein
MPEMCPPTTSQYLGRSHDYVCLNFGSNFAGAVSVRNRGFGGVGCGI